jgi:hypothetical protein
VEWHEDQDSVDANNDLIRRVNAQMVLLWAAERKCANAIYDIIGFPHIEAASDTNPNGYGVNEIPDGAETPWGKTVERSESCGEKAANAVGHFVWDGVIVGGIWGTVEGLGSLTLGYNPQTGEWFDGDTYGAAWSNLGKLAVGLAVTSPLTIPVIANMPGPAGRFLRDCQMTVVNAGKGLVAWDKWKDDPAAAAGEATFNIASIIIPAGAATAPVRTSASTTAAAIRTAAKIIDVVDPASALIKVGTAGAKIAMPAIADLVKSIDLSKIGIDNLGTKIDIPELPKVDAPKVEVPSVNTGDMTLDTPHTGSTADVPVRTVDGTAVTVPAREPVLVGSGGGDTAVHIGDSGPSGDGGHTGGSGGSIARATPDPVLRRRAAEGAAMARSIVLQVAPAMGAERNGIPLTATLYSPTLTTVQASRASTTVTRSSTLTMASPWSTTAGWAMPSCRRTSMTFRKTFRTWLPIAMRRTDATQRTIHTLVRIGRHATSMRTTGSATHRTTAQS